MEPGWPFLFKLHSPKNFIVGGGFFIRFSQLPCFLAWEAFGEKNGATSLRELIERVARYRHAPQTPGSVLGCNILNAPFFFLEHEWIPIPKNWPANVQRGMTYDTNESYGRALWDEVVMRLEQSTLAIADATKVADKPRFGAQYLTHARLGQGAFRVLVTDAYHRRCAVTGEKTLPALEAAHIQAHSAFGPNHVNNGLLLRADIHRLFDDGYVTIDRDLRFLVSKRVREEFENGREYYQFHGRPLVNLPDAPEERPSAAFLEWHNGQFLGN
ncbi:MAG: hypothetical protein NFCOHLIN_01334 [Gammaproteobacteria bacterium]|nr:hypothetical protein [Gammaproteobacteria bacterium]